jgi:hypothetical protein
MALQSTTAIATVTLQSVTPSVTFSGIPSTYRDLILVVNQLGTANATGGILRLNSDSTSSYSRGFMFGTGSTAAAGAGSGIYADIFFPRTTLGNATFHFLDYSATDKHKTILNRVDVSDYVTWAAAARWANPAAINSLFLAPDSGQWAAGSTFALYGRIA